MDDTRFEVLEQLNAQVDVWIDQEEFDLVLNTFKCSPPETRTDPRDQKDFNDCLEKAFPENYCTFILDKEWDDLLNVTFPPLIEFRFPNNSWKPFFKDDSTLEKKWVWFFWAKLIRAKIQQKGSDCYFSRLDQLVVFLERNQPVVKQNSAQTKLAVIYLLEMAASGLGADQRSFAERARRILRERFKEIQKDKFFFNFYDLLARYTIGVGFLHDGQGRKAISEFNVIIKKLSELCAKKGDPNQSVSAPNWTDYVNKRHGCDVLYLPAVLGRASIETKLQLAYHALETIKDYWKTPQSAYLTAKKECLLAEANRLMDNGKTSKTNLESAAEILFENCQTSSPLTLPTKWEDRFKQINTVCEQKWGNIQGRLFDIYVALHLDKLKEDSTNSDLSESLESICKIFSMYWEASKWQDTNRVGYFQLVAAYLSWIAKKIKPDGNETANEKFSLIATKIYKDNQHFLNPDNQNNEVENSDSQDDCPYCSNLGIKLERLGPSHYLGFVKDLQNFYREFKIKNDSIRFRERLFELEKKHKEDSAYRKREMAMDHLEAPPDWCKECIGGETTPGMTSFSGLLNCANFHEKKNDAHSEHGRALPLSSKHYEHLMDHWDKRFLNHLESESVHLPRCKALHLIGLQRWNSTSPAIGRSLGGGYLIYHTNNKGQVDLGVAVDPGFDFVRNLFHLGFSLSDIDVVLLSHAHLDHIRDFESLVTLCLELNKRHPDKVKRRLHTIMTLGVYHRLSHIFDSAGLREFVEPYILDIEKEIRPKFIEPYIDKLKYYQPFLKPNENNSKPEINPNSHRFVFQEKLCRQEANTDRGRFRFLAKTPSESNNDKGLHLSITATRAYHNDFSEYSDSFGFKIKISVAGREADACTIGYTGDTSWSPDIIDQYKKCDALLVHIGSLIDREKDICFDDYKEDGQKCWDLIKNKNHPYLFGLLRFLTEIAGQRSAENGKVPLVLLSEFGEELRGRIRLDLYNRLSTHYNRKDALRKISLLPLDVGLDVILGIDDESKDERSYNRLRTLLKENAPPFLVKCVVCEEFVVLQQVDFETYGHDEALYCVCKACSRSTPQNVLQVKLRDLYEVAHPLLSYY